MQHVRATAFGAGQRSAVRICKDTVQLWIRNSIVNSNFESVDNTQPSMSEMHHFSKDFCSCNFAQTMCIPHTVELDVDNAID
jgi:hypothetical protein